MAETRTSARMARLVAEWRKSGESGAGFARRHQSRARAGVRAGAGHPISTTRTITSRR